MSEERPWTLIECSQKKYSDCLYNKYYQFRPLTAEADCLQNIFIYYNVEFRWMTINLCIDREKEEYF